MITNAYLPVSIDALNGMIERQLMLRISPLVKDCRNGHLFWPGLANHHGRHHQDQGPTCHKHPHLAHRPMINLTAQIFGTTSACHTLKRRDRPRLGTISERSLDMALCSWSAQETWPTGRVYTHLTPWWPTQQLYTRWVAKNWDTRIPHLHILFCKHT